jgi:SNF2 family DNA or RNA helicase
MLSLSEYTTRILFALGKTVQTISVIGHIMFSELIVGPFLIIVPQSTADNWLNEFRVSNNDKMNCSMQSIKIYSNGFQQPT